MADGAQWVSRRPSGQPEFAEVLYGLGIRGIWPDRLSALYELLYGPEQRTRGRGWEACEQLRLLLAELPSLLETSAQSLLIGEAEADQGLLDDHAAGILRQWYLWQTQLYRRQLELVQAPPAPASRGFVDETTDWLATLLFEQLDPFLTPRLRHADWSRRSLAP